MILNEQKISVIHLTGLQNKLQLLC